MSPIGYIVKPWQPDRHSVKKAILKAAFLSFLLPSLVWGAQETDPYDQTNLFALLFGHPYSLGSEVIVTGPARISKPRTPNQTIRLSYLSVDGSYSYRIDSLSGLVFAGGYRKTWFDWKENPFFLTRDYDEVYVALQGFTACLPAWLWRFQLGLSTQTSQMNAVHYGTFEGVLWGRYQFLCDVGLHIGVIAFKGKKKTFVRPIIGWDRKIGSTWNLSVIYPIDVSLTHDFNCMFSGGIGARFMRNRQRFTDGQKAVPSNTPIGFIEYRSWGLEIKANFHPIPGLEFEGFIGSMLDPWVKVYNNIGRSFAYRELNNVYYFGGNASWRF